MSTEVLTEQVLVVPTELLHRLGHFQGFSTDVDRYLGELLSPRNTSYRPRSEMEADPSFKQLIPYVIFTTRAADGGLLVFRYTARQRTRRSPAAQQTQRGHRRAYFGRRSHQRRRGAVRRGYAPRAGRRGGDRLSRIPSAA